MPATTLVAASVPEAAQVVFKAADISVQAPHPVAQPPTDCASETLTAPQRLDRFIPSPSVSRSSSSN